MYFILRETSAEQIIGNTIKKLRKKNIKKRKIDRWLKSKRAERGATESLCGMSRLLMKMLAKRTLALVEIGAKRCACIYVGAGACSS